VVKAKALANARGRIGMVLGRVEDCLC